MKKNPNANAANENAETNAAETNAAQTSANENAETNAAQTSANENAETNAANAANENAETSAANAANENAAQTNADANDKAKQAANVINVRYGQRRAAVVAALRPLFLLMRATLAAENVASKKNVPSETAKKELGSTLSELRDLLLTQAKEPLAAKSIRISGSVLIVIKENDGEFELDEEDLNAICYKKERNAPAGSSLALFSDHLRAAAEEQVKRDEERRAAAKAKKDAQEPRVSNAELLAAVKDGTLTVVKKIDAKK